MNDKYIVKNCPAGYENPYSNESKKCINLRPNEYCQNTTNCLIKQVIEKCKETLNIMNSQLSTNAYAGGRCVEAEKILRLFEIEYEVDR